MIVLLDAGPLGLVTHPRGTPASQACKQWFASMHAVGVRVTVPEIADYEVRRELLRARRLRGVAHLDQLKATAGYLPITTDTMLQAAEFWALARQRGQPTTTDAALDGDVILAAQAVLLAKQGDPVIIATTNVGHLARFTATDLWQNIQAPTP